MLKNLKHLTPAETEEEVLKFWQKDKTFEKSLQQAQGKSLDKKTSKGDFVFYDGPPFATGLPHYGHILTSILKDVIPRYQTMKGKIVPRRWGWDCHGLPIENEIEKKLGLKTKKDIENIGIGVFNESARDNVLQYADEWKKIIPRVGRWVDMERDYKTMDSNYTESVWWVFKSLFDKGLVYEGNKSMHVCPRCETPLANFELNQPGAYRDITDISITVKFELLEEKNTYILAWTTTPWTLPGNVALAINPKIDYVKVSKGSENLILAKSRLAIIEGEYKILETFKGKNLIGKKYQPVFDYYSSAGGQLKNRENGWKIYPADFVSIEEGTGIVHIAPAFGEDDMKLGNKFNLPFVQHVSTSGKFKPEVKDFAGMDVKPKENHQITDIEIIKWLAKENKLFSKQKIVHSYPHCWRCDTPLLNYASTSWFVKATDIKKKLIENNKKINWIPGHIKEGRFGKWLEEVRDWAISRTRFWGAPLPVWQCNKCDKREIIGSLEELKNKIEKSGNKYFVMRHGEAQSNVKNIASCNVKNSHHLTEKGKKQAIAAGSKLKKEKIDLIFASDYLRTKETAEIVADKLEISKKDLIFDQRLREINVGIFDGQSAGEYHKYFSSLEEKFYKNPPKGENLTELKNRVSEFLYEIDKKYSCKNILIVSHEYSIWQMFAGALGANPKKAVEIKYKDDFIKTAEIKKLDFIPIPHNKNYELDFHRPYIDEMVFPCSNSAGSGKACGGEMTRIKDVFDCWFESGSMPYSQIHYPFENKKWFEDNFPAEFIAEGIDQTRGWFYTLLVLSTALFNKPAYKNVIVSGIVLAQDGQKMSKRLKNYPDPMEIVNKYGADALRLYLLSSPLVRGENLNFSGHGVDEVYKKVILRFWNTYKFYELYNNQISSSKNKIPNPNNVLDKWIIARLKELVSETSKFLDSYELDRASRPIFDFVDDLSTWYIRRSRERFKGDSKDKKSVATVTSFVLIEFSKVTAPFMPFISEGIYKSLTSGRSVHLENWPKAAKLTPQDNKIIENMKSARQVASSALQARAKNGIKVRQPLASLKIKNEKLEIRDQSDFLNLIKDEINVKEIIFDKDIKEEIELDLKITAELRQEGIVRDISRMVQELRQDAGCKPQHKIDLHIEVPEEIKNALLNYINELKEKVGAKNIEFRRNDKFDAEIETKIDDSKIWIGIKKL
ncbi:MAG: class I tRNA ligase family protein [Patescibacteria group bacterium]